jgi:hypothetical protein
LAAVGFDDRFDFGLPSPSLKPKASRSKLEPILTLKDGPIGARAPADRSSQGDHNHGNSGSTLIEHRLGAINVMPPMATSGNL